MNRSFILPHQRQQLRDFYDALPKDRRYKVTIEEYKKSRSLGLNAYAWGYVVTPIAQFVGESAERQWEIMCGEYFGWVEKEFRGHRYLKPRRTTTTNEKGDRSVLDGEAMRDFVHYCESVAAELGVAIQFPEGEAA